jgi:hypothetical protein
MTVYQEPKTGWLQHPTYPECEEYVDERGYHIARIEDFGYAAYPSAHNAQTGNWERHGPTRDRVEGKLWAERVAGIHPVKPGDERPPFYYSRDQS